ncbi:MAG: single-stranded-DNA-specific exonuclease RecJ [Anaerolineae bacterium]|nr:single-stranded-DNA-specific exonuclease RecJ [Anaerolineae bacterium]
MLTKQWLDPAPIHIPADLRECVGGHPLVAEILARRGIDTVAAARAFLDPQYYIPAPPTDLPGLSCAVDRIQQAIHHQELICVWGDFDVDGQTATTLLVSALRQLGARVRYHIPVRALESHGIKTPWLQRELDAGIQLLLTCDTGIAAHDAVAYANSRHVDVIITDHHELPLPDTLSPSNSLSSLLPAAYAIVNPHLLPGMHPLSTLPGVGVAYKLVEELYRRVDRIVELSQFLDLVALGIVADVAEQVRDTRYLLQLGLAALRNTHRLGLQEMLRLAHIVPAHLTAETIGFELGPRLNALGRLEDANVIVEFLTTTDLTTARILASELEALNARRKLICDQVTAAAIAQVEQQPDLLEYAALVLAPPISSSPVSSAPTWPPGVIGIVASRLVERYQRPVVLISTSSDEIGRGSARSIAGCHITTAIATQTALLENFGGHEMAAGLSIRSEHIPAFRRGLSRAVAAQLEAGRVTPTLQIDAYVSLTSLSLELVADLARLAPFGAGNVYPLLATRNLVLKSQHPLGRTGRHLRLTVADEMGTERQVVWWQWDNRPLPSSPFDLAYSARINTYREQRELQLVWEHAREGVTSPAGVALEPSLLEIIDYRFEPDPQPLLKSLLADGVQIWAEGESEAQSPGIARDKLSPGATLVIWTLPPSPAVTATVLAQVNPERIYLFSTMPSIDRESQGRRHFEGFIKHLAGRVKYALHQQQGQFSVLAVAGAMAHLESTVRKGLDWLVAKGHVCLLRDIGDVVYLDVGSGVPVADAVAIAGELQDLLAETLAYRLYFARAPVSALRQSLTKNKGVI